MHGNQIVSPKSLYHTYGSGLALTLHNSRAASARAKPRATSATAIAQRCRAWEYERLWHGFENHTVVTVHQASLHSDVRVLGMIMMRFSGECWTALISSRLALLPGTSMEESSELRTPKDKRRSTWPCTAAPDSCHLTRYVLFPGKGKHLRR